MLAPLSLLQDGKPVKIIVSKNATAADTKIATDIMKIFGDITNVTMFPKQDTEAVGEDEVAILVGNTVIPESDLVYRELEQTYGYSYGTVRVKNNKIVIAGLSDSVKERCANELKKEINKLSIKSENIELSRDYCVDILDSKMLNNIPVSQDIKAQSAIDTGDSCYMVNF